MNIIVIGAGAAGMMAAIAAAEAGHKVTIVEKNEKVGKKIYITGKGRCNLTNDCEEDTFYKSVRRNPRFLYSSYSAFSAQDAMDKFEQMGLKIKVERGNRVFPVSDKSSDVIRVLAEELKRLGVNVLLNTAVTEVITELKPSEDPENVAELDWDPEFKPTFTAVKLSDGKTLKGDRCIIATGGLSYPTTGSTGDGYKFAEKLGHTVKSCSPSLVSLHLKEDVTGLEGLSLKNVSLTVKRPVEKRGKIQEKQVYSDFGEMLFTAKGISGPLVLSASAELAGLPLEGVSCFIDLKPALSPEQLDARVLHDFSENSNKQFRNSLGDLLPARMAEYIVEKSGIDPFVPVHQVTAEERERLVKLLKALPFSIKALGGYNEAVITAGGVDVKEVNPSTMESKLVKGLFFAGEVLDLDAVTGGFNLQIAWTTGMCAGRNTDV